MEEQKYTIGDKIYTQRPLVLGQVKQLIDLLRGTTIPANSSGVELIGALGESLPVALAIVLTEEGKSPGDKDIFELARELEFSVSPETALDVIDHFFALNPMPSLLKRVGDMMLSITQTMGQTGILLQKSASSSPTGELTSETGSSGTSH
jgi:hypothetical protein